MMSTVVEPKNNYSVTYESSNNIKKTIPKAQMMTVTHRLGQLLLLCRPDVVQHHCHRQESKKNYLVSYKTCTKIINIPSCIV